MKKLIFFILLSFLFFSGVAMSHASDIEFYAEDFESFEGYRIIYPRNWTSISKHSFEEGLDMLVLARNDDNSQSITLGIRDVSVVEADFDVVVSLNDSLNRKNIKVGEIYRDEFSVNEIFYPVARAEVENSRAYLLADFRTERFSVVATLGSKSNEVEQNMEDLIAIFTLFDNPIE